MRITDEILVKFFGHSDSRGFTVQSIKRYGGFIRTEEDLEDAHYLAMKALISARDRGKEFDDELHMINYMQKSCYFSWCTVGKNRMNGIEGVTVSNSSMMIGEGDDEYCRVPEPGVEPVYPDLLTERVLSLAREKFGEVGADVVRACVIDSLSLAEAGRKLNLKPDRVKSYLRVCMIHIKRSLRSETDDIKLTTIQRMVINMQENEINSANKPKKPKGQVRLRNSGNMDSRSIIIG